MSADEAGVGSTADILLRAIDAYEHGELDASRVLCEQHLRAEPANAVALMLLGLIAKKSLKIEEAIPLLERSVREEINPKALTSLADCL